jgi:hypothetical protein
MNLIGEVEMVYVDWYLYEHQVILNLFLLNYDYPIERLVNEVTEVLDYGLKK